MWTPEDGGALGGSFDFCSLGVLGFGPFRLVLLGPILVVFVVQRELLLLHLLQLVLEVELGRLLLELGKLVLVFGHFLQGGFHAAIQKKYNPR